MNFAAAKTTTPRKATAAIKAPQIKWIDWLEANRWKNGEVKKCRLPFCHKGSCAKL